MNEGKTLRRYIHWSSPVKKLLTLLLFLAAAGSLFMAVQASNKKDPTPVELDTFRTEDGSYVYVDAVGVSDWVYQVGNNTTYYMLLDAEDNYFVAVISDEDYKTLSAQKRYFEEDVEMPDPVRLIGVCKNTGNAVRDSFMDVLELEGDQFDAYFGKTTLWVGETPSKNSFGAWMFLTVLLLGGGVALLLINLLKGKETRRALARLEQRGLLNQAQSELESPTVRSEQKDQFRLGTRFLFGKGIGLAASWEDVIWCYLSVSEYNFIVRFRKLIICTADGVQHRKYFRLKQKDEMVALMDYIQERNPNVMLGYSLDNNRAWREAVKRQ